MTPRQSDRRTPVLENNSPIPEANGRAVLVARQPIVNRRRDVVAYELLFRGDWGDRNEGDSNRATAQVLSETVFMRSLEGMGTGLPLFVNFTRDVLLAGLGRVLTPPSGYVLELLETVEPESNVLAECRRMRARGLRVALDDVVDGARIRAFSGSFDVVKVDVLAAPPAALAGLVTLAHARGGIALAEKIENEQMMTKAMALGFDHFQGYQLGRPVGLPGRALTGIPSQQVRLLDVLQEPELSVSRLEQVVVSDPTLTYKVLQFANSAQAAQVRRVQSVRSALVLCGIDQVRRAASLAFLSGLAGKIPSYLLEQSVVRSRLCEEIGAVLEGREQAPRYLLVGLLSNLNLLLGTDSLEAAISRLRLDEAIMAAIVHEEGTMGRALSLVRAYETAQWSRVGQIAASLGISLNALAKLYHTAIQAAAHLLDD